MQKKLTLNIDQQLFEEAKNYAQQRGRSLSNLIEDYLKLMVINKKEPKETSKTPITDSLKGILKEGAAMNEQQILEDELLKKYML